MLAQLFDYKDSSSVSPQLQRTQPGLPEVRPAHQLNQIQAIVVWVVSALLVLSIGWFAYKTIRIGLYGWSAYQSGMSLLSSARADTDTIDAATLRADMAQLADAVRGLEAQMRSFAPILRSLQDWTPYGATLAAVPALLTVGTELTALGSEAVDLIAPVLSAEDGSQLDALAAIVEDNPARLAALADYTERANVALLSIPADQVLPALSGPLAQAQSLAPLMGPSLQAAQAFPDLLGMRKPVTYLILFQNNHELRGTGGFISAAGALTMSRGQIVALETENAYDVYSDTLEYPQAPEPIQKYLKSEILVFRDANWSPDLPTSGRTAIQLYEQVRDVQIDGVVTVDLNAVELIVDALDGIQVEGVEDVITGANVVEIIKNLWGNPLNTDATTDTNWSEWYESRKDFVPVLAGAILDRLKSRDFSLMRVVAAGTEALDQRAIQIWFENPQTMSQFTAAGWDGALHNVNGADYLALVDTNVGFNKVNAVVTREISYTVTWPEDGNGRAQAVAKITYVHPVTKPDHECDPTPRYGDTYDDMISRCYFNYVRLYVPRDSRLISIEGVEDDSISSRRGEARSQVLAGYFIMEPGSVHTVTFTYELPATIKEESYRLIAQRQSGSGPLPLRWQIGDGRAERTIIEGNWLDWTPD